MGYLVGKQRDDFLILGPSLAREKKVLEAVHAMYFLPDNFTLIFTGSAPVGQFFYSRVIELIEHLRISDRVQFKGRLTNYQAVILPNINKTKDKKAVSGDTAEAMASAVLDLARKQP